MNFPSKEKIDETRKKGLRPVTSACVINKKKLLMVYDKKYNLWQLPQGGIDNNEDMLEALTREVGEEMNLEFAKKLFDFKLVGQNTVKFPKKTQGNRKIKSDKGKNIFMLGKKYYFILAKTNLTKINLKHSQFDKYKWVTYNDAKKITGQIYQSGKKRITKYILEKLYKNNYIK